MAELGRNEKKTTVTDDGRSLGFYGIAPYSEWTWFGMLIKQEALDKTGLPVPTTIDEWYEFLKKQGSRIQGAAELRLDVRPNFTGIINGAYGVWDWTFLDENGKVAWGPAQPKAKEYLATMQRVEQGRLAESGLGHRRFQSTDGKRDFRRYGRHDGFPDTMWSYWKVQNDIDFVGR